MAGIKKYNFDMREKVLDLQTTGLTATEIAEELGIEVSEVRDIRDGNCEFVKGKVNGD